MLRRSFLPVITSWLSGGNKHIMNVAYCSTLTSDSSHVHPEGAENINVNIKMKEKIKKKKSKPKKEKGISIEETLDKETLDIINHMQSINPNMSSCPKQWIKVARPNVDMLYLMDRDTAAKYVSFIIKDLLKNTCFVAELNPGFGLLTTELLKAGVPLIHLYQSKELHPMLDRVHSMFPGRLDVRNSNLFNISKMYYLDRIIGGERIQEALQGVESRRWEDETCMQIINATCTAVFFRHLVKSLLFRNCFMTHGRPVFYIALPPSLWDNFICNSSGKMYTYTKVMLRAMFDCEHLGTLNRKAFLPWPRNKPAIRYPSYQLAKLDYEQIYVTRIEPRANLYSQLSQEDWITFWYFVRHHMQKRSNRVIAELEKWAPGCGIRLIAKDYTIFTQFGDLTPAQLVELFKEFKSWPEYKESYFLASMKDSLHDSHNDLELLEFENLKLEK